MRFMSAVALSMVTSSTAFAVGQRRLGRVAFAGVRSMMTMSLEDDIKSTISSSDVVVYSKSTCPFCRATKETFKQQGIHATVIELNEVDGGADIQATLLEITGQRTVPNVFIKGQHLGGNDDTQAAVASGKLKEMLGA